MVTDGLDRNVTNWDAALCEADRYDVTGVSVVAEGVGRTVQVAELVIGVVICKSRTPNLHAFR